MLKKISEYLVTRAERRIGVELDSARRISQVDFGLFRRYGSIFSFLDGNSKAPPVAYHAARLRGALASDCGTCVEAEINLARNSGLDASLVDRVLSGEYAELPDEVAAVARLSDAVVARREDDPDARMLIVERYGEAALIEIAFAMNGAALLPGIKRTMGYATACNLDILRRQAQAMNAR